MKHVLIKDDSLNGREYGVLRSMEEEIIRQTNAQVIKLPTLKLPSNNFGMGHNMRFAKARKLIKKKSLNIEADVIWCILMGPENYKLDLFKGWDKKASYRIVYLFDTLKHQLPTIKKLFSNNQFNIKISSFNDAIPMVEKETGCKWHFVTQAVPPHLFYPVSLDKKVIAFSSYGRKLEKVHHALKEFCEENSLYYDFTTETNAKPLVSAMELYNQYAWHVNHSVFNISWPVELTNPERASSLNPITCRWFEAAAANTIIMGAKPKNLLFNEFFPEDFVLELNIEKTVTELKKDFLGFWEKREIFYQNRKACFEKDAQKWFWEARVKEIREIIGAI